MVLTTDDENKHFLWIVGNQQSVEVEMIMDSNNLYKKKRTEKFWLFLLIVKVRYFAFVVLVEHVAFGWYMKPMKMVNNWDRQRMLIDFVMRNKHVYHV
jgi:cytoskeletal protein RodZ